ncbi:DUF397 domain-containing protein [Streptomyces sp. NPDC003077]|uniref:DUF397 domain-containing protein n=1 Tax=Streptomyces sp. NPDC003077 TaxID=3154443 RepID=UPI0033BB9EEB
MSSKPSAGDAVRLNWTKSSYSDTSNSNECVEVAAASGMVRVRDSKNASGPQLVFPASTWADFLACAIGS